MTGTAVSRNPNVAHPTAAYIVTDERCVEYSTPGHPETPARVLASLARLRSQKDLTVTWVTPVPATDEPILRAHSPELIDKVVNGTRNLDMDTPRLPRIDEHARRAVGGALAAMKAGRDGKMAFSLMRPPGHHATRQQAMGFCYFNNVAVAVLEALATGVERVAVLDFDVHHGNGTEAILLGHPKAATFDIHQFPCYPGTGKAHLGKNAFNYPVPPKTPAPKYREFAQQAFTDLKAFRPTLVAVSAGFDAYARDPLAQLTLEKEDYQWLGAQIRALGIPCFTVLEGGYSNDLPELILSYLKGLCGVG